MYKIAIWGTGRIYDHYINTVKYQELLGKIRGGDIYITGKENLYDFLDGYRYLNLQQLKAENIDYIVVATDQFFNEVVGEAKQLGFDREHILPIRIFAMPCFDFDNYVKLLHSHISIFSNSCWGGVTYHSLAMKFRSPLINMFESDEDYLKILANPQYYFDLKLQFDSWGNNSEWYYPICRLGDVTLHFNHSKSMEEVEKKWYDRVNRINYENIFAMMYTERESSLEKFVTLPYKKKVCFLPFESTYPCACTLQYASKKTDEPFWRLVNCNPGGMYHDYDIITMLNSGIPNHSRIISAF